MFYNQLKELCEKSGKMITNVVYELGLSSGNLSKWKNGGVPKIDTAQKIANYFNVSVDYLLGKEDKKISSPQLSSEDMAAFEQFKMLGAEQQKLVLDMIANLKKK